MRIIKLFICMCMIWATGCAKEPLHQQQSFVFGTLVEVSIYGENEMRAKQLVDQVLRDFDQMHRELHAWKPSTVTQMNQVFANSPARAPLPPGMREIIEHAAALSQSSNGLFNPAIGKLIELWGFQSDEFKPTLPALSKVNALVKANPRMADIVIDGFEFYSKNPAVSLDLGGFAKGYALDREVRYLRAQGVKNALINIGGNVIAIGQHGKRSWRVGIQHPRKPSALATVDLRDGEAIGTSGDYQRYFELDGKRFCHIIDPRTGYPAQGVQAATVLTSPGATAGILSDAASKPIFISGPQGWRQAARQMNVADAMLIDEAGKIYLTKAMKDRLTFNETGLVLEVTP